MSYEEIDKILFPWLKKYGLQVFTKGRGDEARFLFIVDDVGDTYQISISPLSEFGKITIYFGCYKTKKSKTIVSELSELESALEAIYAEIMQWIQKAGQTRTPVL